MTKIKDPDKTLIFKQLAECGIDVITIEHPPAMTVSDILSYSLPAPACKNLFLKDSKNNVWLLIALPDTQAQLKALAKLIKAPELRFAQEDLLKEVLGVEPFFVTLFGILNDTKKHVTVLIDRSTFKEKRVGFHPLYNTATTFMNTKDIIPFLQAASSPFREINCYEAY